MGRWVVNAPPRLLYSRERYPVPIVIKLRVRYITLILVHLVVLLCGLFTDVGALMRLTV